MSRFCFILNYWYWYWYWSWIFNILIFVSSRSVFGIIIAVTASFGISLVTYYLLICFFGITTFFSINPEGCLLAAIIPIKIYSNAEAEKAQIFSDNQKKIWYLYVDK